MGDWELRELHTDDEPAMRRHWEITKAAISDHRSGVCSHREFGATLWAGVFDLTARRLAYSFGAPCRNVLQPFAFPGDGPR